MLRGDIVLVSYPPHDDARPAVIVSNDRATTAVSRIGQGNLTVVPLSPRIMEIFPFQVHVPAAESGLALDTKAQAERVTSVAVEDVHQVVGRLTETLQKEIDEALRLHLSV